MDEKPKPAYASSSRIESLTDGIFAFAMTLLILNLNAPQLRGVVTNQELIQKLGAMSDRFFIFLLSFFLLASAWGVHHRQFSIINKTDSKLMWINMLRLLLVVTVPFSSVLVGNYSYLSIAVLFFDLNIFLLSLVSFVEWKYAVSHNLTQPVTPEHIKSSDIKNLFPIFVAAAACILSFINPSLSLWTFALIPIGLLFLRRTKKIL